MTSLQTDLLSIVVPCFNEAEGLVLFYDTVIKYVKDIPVQYEFIFINDGSEDDTLQVIQNISNQDLNVFYDSFSRNFGKEAAMYAGLAASRGDYTVIMDADLQHPPYLLKAMYELVKQAGVDCAGAKRVNRSGEGGLRNYLSQKFYKCINAICCVNMDDGAGDYRMMSRQMVQSLLSIHEVNRYTKGLFSYIGFHCEWITYENVARSHGESKWSMVALFAYALDAITSFSNVPLLLAAVFGMLFCLIAFMMFLAMLVINYDKVFMIVGFLLLIGGIQLLFIGILGEYLAKNVAESRHRPLYIIKESNRK